FSIRDQFLQVTAHAVRAVRPDEDSAHVAHSAHEPDAEPEDAGATEADDDLYEWVRPVEHDSSGVAGERPRPRTRRGGGGRDARAVRVLRGDYGAARAPATRSPAEQGALDEAGRTGWLRLLSGFEYCVAHKLRDADLARRRPQYRIADAFADLEVVSHRQ